MNWIEKNLNTIAVVLACLFLVEVGIGAWRLPKEFRSAMLPKLENQIAQYDNLVSSYSQRLDLIEKYVTYNQEHILNNRDRIDLHSDIARQGLLHTLTDDK